MEKVKEKKQKEKSTEKPKVKKLSDIYNILPIDFFNSLSDEKFENHLNNIKK